MTPTVDSLIGSMDTLEGLILFTEQEINRIRHCSNLSNESYEQMQKATLLAIDLRTAVSLAKEYSLCCK